MITVQVNGKPVELDGATPLLAYLEKLGVDPRAIAVEHNGTIIERAAYQAVTLKEGDIIEIVRMVGGGVVCPCCGRDITSVEREIKMELPDAVRAIPERERRKRVGVGGTSFMQLDLQRYFVRALLPVRLSDGHEFHFGVWLEIAEETSKRLWTDWERPEYAAIRFEATLANSVPPWNESVLGAHCVASIRNQNQLPYIESSTQPRLATVMATPWPRAECEELLDRVWNRAARS